MITEYMENATLQEISFPRAGSDNLTKSENSTLFFTNKYRKSSLMSLLRKDTAKHAASSISLDREVAMATPVAPSLGAPRRLNINTAFKIIFIEKASIFMAVLIMTRPMLRRTARYTSVMPQHR